MKDSEKNFAHVKFGHTNKDKYSFTPKFIRRPFKKSTQRRSRPNHGDSLQISLKQPAKRTFISFRQESISKGSPFQLEGPTKSNIGECATLSSCSRSTRHQ